MNPSSINEMLNRLKNPRDNLSYCREIRIFANVFNYYSPFSNRFTHEKIYSCIVSLIDGGKRLGT